ncbi:MAG: hypothetical protein AMXMBFR84_21350 [Candidatus Hydrogenedentota bacterium]
MTSSPQKEFRWYEGLAILFGMIGIQLMSEILALWGTYFYSPPPDSGRIVYVSIGMASVIFAVGSIFDAITDPLVGAWSDQTRTTPGWGRLIPLRGRRRPFIFWGGLMMVGTSVLFWYPPVPHESAANLIYGCLMLCLHWFAFTIAMVPLNSLAPEIARSQEGRIRIGQWVAIGMIVGLAIANIAPAMLLEPLDTGRAAANAAGDVISPQGYRNVALLFGIISLVCFWFPVFAIRERYEHVEGANATATIRELVQALTNRVFVMYLLAFFCFSIGLLATQRALPYWITVGLGQKEEALTMLMGPFIVSALVSSVLFMPLLSKRLKPKWLLFLSFVLMSLAMPAMYPVAIAPIDGNTKLLLGAVLFSISGLGQGIQYVVIVSLLGEIIDLDEQRRGERREAVYNGASGLAFKVGQAFSVIVAAQSMNVFGNTPNEPLGIYLVGPIAGMFALAGMVVVWFYPVLHVTPATAAEVVRSSRDRPTEP